MQGLSDAFRNLHWIAMLLFAVSALGAGGLPFGVAYGAEASIVIDNFTFTPAQLTVVPNTQVRWINHDDIPHLVVDAKDAHAMKSSPLDTGDSFAFTFTSPGTYHYFCALHPMMTGTIVVK